MTSHDRALEAAAKELLAHGEFGMTAYYNNQNSRTAAAAAITAYLSALSPDVSGLVERLNSMLSQTGRDHRTGHEFITHYTSQDQVDAMRSARDALASLSLQLAGYEIDPYNDVRKQRARAETAEASLSAAQEENERLRKALEKIAAEDDTGPLVYEADEKGRLRLSHNAPGRFAEISRATLSTPSKEDKTDAE